MLQLPSGPAVHTLQPLHQAVFIQRDPVLELSDRGYVDTLALLQISQPSQNSLLFGYFHFPTHENHVLSGLHPLVGSDGLFPGCKV